MWVGGNGAIAKIRITDGAVLSTTQFIGLTISLVFDGTSIWAVQSAGTQVSQLRLSDAAFLQAFDSGGTGTYALAFDGANIWVSLNTANQVAKL